MNQKFRLYWLDGKTNIVEGTDIANAMNNAGYGGGSIRALDFYDNGEGIDYVWDNVQHKWNWTEEKRKEVLKAYL